MMNNNYQDLPIIDWDQLSQFTGNKHDNGKELLNLLISNLSQELLELKQIEQLKNYRELYRRIHKLHGALCYCGVPRLKYVVAELESFLKQQKYAKIPESFNLLEIEAQKLITEIKSIS